MVCPNLSQLSVDVHTELKIIAKIRGFRDLTQGYNKIRQFTYLKTFKLSNKQRLFTAQMYTWIVWMGIRYFIFVVCKGNLKCIWVYIFMDSKLIKVFLAWLLDFEICMFFEVNLKNIVLSFLDFGKFYLVWQHLLFSYFCQLLICVIIIMIIIIMIM